MRDRRVQCIGKHRQPVDVAQLPLIRCHAQSGVALGMFDGLEPFLCGQLHIGDFHIVLEIQPRLGPQSIAGPLRHHPDGGQRPLVGVGRHRCGGDALFMPRVMRSGLACRDTVSQHVPTAQMAVGDACRDHETLPVSTCRRAGGVGAEHRLRVVPDQLAAAMRPQMHDRRPAARHRHAIAGDLLQHGPFAGLRTQGDARHTLAAFHLGDAFAIGHADAQSAGLVDQRPFGCRARIDDDRHLQPRLFQGDGRAVSVVVVGHDHGAIPDGDAEIDRIIAHRPRQQHAGQIVAREGQRPLDCARRGHDPLRPYPPESVARAVLIGRVIGQPFIGQSIAVVINACTHATCADRDIWHFFKRLQRGLHPIRRIHPVDLRPVHDSAPTPVSGLLDQQHPRAGLTRCQRRRQPCDPATDHQHVHVAVEMLVGIRVTVLGRAAQTGGLPDERLVDMFPERAREHEHLVVKARRQEPRQMRVDRTHVEFKAGPVVLAGRRQPVEQFGRGDALVRLERRLSPQIHQSIGFFCPCRHHTARAVVFEGPADQHLVIGQQRRGQRIPRKPAQALAVEGETDRLGAVDQATLAAQTRAHAKSPHVQPGRLAEILARRSGGGSVVCAG